PLLRRLRPETASEGHAGAADDVEGRGASLWVAGAGECGRDGDNRPLPGVPDSAGGGAIESTFECCPTEDHFGSLAESASPDSAMAGDRALQPSRLARRRSQN